MDHSCFFVDDIALATGKGAVFILHICIRYKQTFLSYHFSKNVFETLTYLNLKGSFKHPSSTYVFRIAFLKSLSWFKPRLAIHKLQSNAENTCGNGMWQLSFNNEYYCR